MSIKKLFGDINLTWPKLIIFSVIMGIYTAIVAMLIPDGNSFHDIAVTLEWWVLPAVLIIANCKKPLEAALKTFVFFLISQPLVYLVQILCLHPSDWSLFGYYRYWFDVTLLTFPGAFIGWFIKKNQWYSGIILSVMTCLLAITGVNYIHSFIETPPNHLISIIYCFGIIPVFIFAIFSDKIARIITAAITVIATIIFIATTTTDPFEVVRTDVFSDNNITFTGEPYVSFWSGEGGGNVEINKFEDDEGAKYSLKITGKKGKAYSFTITDDEKDYNFEYHFDKDQNTVVINKK